MNRNHFKVIFGFLLILLTPSLSHAEDPATEMALFEEIPMVVTPGKKLQPINQSPAAVYVITQEDIKASGSINLWDVLRQVPGMDVVTSTVGQADVSMRGFADLATNKTLLLVDGRSMYLPLQGLMLWEMMPVQLEEIERIEVVKGPVASLYGANANLGLINIITKKPKQIDGGVLSTTGGSRDTKRFSVMYGKDQEKLAYKVSTGWKDENSFNNERSRDALDVVQGNALVEYKIDDDSTLGLSGGISQGDFYLYTSNPQNASNWYFGPSQNTMTYLKTDYTRGNFAARFYWNYYKSLYQTAKLYTEAEINTFDGELKYTIETSENNSVIVGGGGRFDHAWATIFAESDQRDHRQGIWDVFIQDDYKISDQWRLNGSIRNDHYENTGDNPSARIAAIYYPNELDTYRFSVGNSFRNPTLSEQYLDLTIDASGTGLTQTARGNKGLQAEKYLTYEISYQGKRMDGRLRPFADLFYTQIEEIIDSYITGGGVIGQDSTWANSGDAQSVGGEIGGEYDVNKQLTLITNYALNHINYNDSEVFWSPKHKVNSGFKFKFNEKLSTRLMAHYVSGAHTTTASDGKVPWYVQGTLWVGYQMKEDIELSVAGYNVFNDKHQEAFGGDDIGSRILGNVTIKF